MKTLSTFFKAFAFILILALANQANGQIFITEIADPNNNTSARYVELYNAGASSVDLSTGWQLQRYTNGNAVPQGAVNLTGTVSAGGFYLIANDASGFTTAYGFAPDQAIGTGGPADSNGDDQIQLLNPSAIVVDIFGVPGEDGTGTCHEFEDGRVERDASVTTGNSGTWNEANWNEWSDSSPAGCTNYAGSSPVDDNDGIFDPGAWIGAPSTVVEPTVQTSAFTFDACVGQMTIAWTNGDGGSRLVKVNTVNSFTAPTDGTSYTGNTVFGGGEQDVFSGPGTSVTVTGLTAGTTYFVTAYEFNGTAGSEDYLTTGNNVASGSTPSIPSTLPAGQDFDSINDIPYCASPEAYYANGSGTDDDVWRVQGSVTSTGTGTISISPSTGSNMWAMQDIDNGNGGGNFEHYLDFGPVDISGYTSVQLSFEYNAYIEAGGSDFLAYQVEYDNGTTWTAASTTIATSTLHTNGAWVTETIAIPGGSNYVRLRIIADFNSGSDIVGIDNVIVEDVTIAAPTGQSNNIISATCQRPNSLNISWTNGNGAGRVVKMNTTNSFTDPVNGTTYSASASYGGGEQVVFNGTTGNSVAVGNLASNTTYYFRVFEYNGTGGNEVYLTSTGTNNPNSFSTTTTPNTLPLGEDFDTDHTLPYCVSPVSYNVSGDVWADVSTLTSITPTNGSGMWGAQDLDNSNGGGAFFHTMDFGPVDVSAYTNARIRFNYNVIEYDYPFDTIRYQVIYDDLNTDWNGTNTELAVGSPGNSGGWVTESINIPAGTNTVRLRIEMLQNGGSDYAAIDEVVVEEIPTGAIVNFSSLSGTVSEDVGTYTVTIEVTNPSSTYPTTVDVALTSGIAANIDNYTTQTITVPAGATSASFTVFITDDLLLDGQESFSFELQNPMTGFVAATAGVSSTHDLTVEDNEVPNLVINEIHYNSDDGGGYPDNDYEYVEIYNNQGVSVDISGYYFSEGVDYTFPASTTIDAEEYIIVAKNPATFTGGGYDVYGPFQGGTGLSNSGEEIELSTSGGIVIDYVDFDDGGGWDNDADGDGPSLALRHFLADNEDKDHWKSSCAVNGTPGAENDVSDYWSLASGNWTTSAIWGWYVPGTIETTTPVDPGFVPDMCDDILIRANHDVVMNVDGSCDDLVVEYYGSLNVNGGTTVTLNGDFDYLDFPCTPGLGTVAFTEGNHTYYSDGLGSVGQLRIPTNADVTVSSIYGFEVIEGITLDGTLDITNGGLTLVSSAGQTAWLDDWDGVTGVTTGSIIGQLTVERYVPNSGFILGGTPLIGADSDIATQLSELNPYGPDGAQLVPSQVSLGDDLDCNPAQLSSTSPYGNPLEWRENTAGTALAGCTDDGWFVNSAGNMEPGRGYSMHRAAAPHVISMTGTPNSGNISYGPIGNTSVTGNGFNLVSNPYPSAFQWQGMAGFDGFAYFWQSTGIYSGTYLPGPPNSPLSLVGPYQGFIVRVSSGTDTFAPTNLMRRAESGTFYRESGNGDYQVDLRIEGNGFGHKTTIYFGAGSSTGLQPTEEWDSMYDAMFYRGNDHQPQIYTLMESDEMLEPQKLSINGLPLLSGSLSVPLGMHVGTEGQYTITATQLGTLPIGTVVVLEDLQESVKHSLTNNNSYTFESSLEDDPDRFIVHFNPVGSQIDSDLGITFYSSNDQVFIQLDNSDEVVGNFHVINYMGQVVLSDGSLIISGGRGTVDVSNLESGVYVVRFSSANGVSADNLFIY